MLSLGFGLCPHLPDPTSTRMSPTSSFPFYTISLRPPPPPPRACMPPCQVHQKPICLTPLPSPPPLPPCPPVPLFPICPTPVPPPYVPGSCICSGQIHTVVPDWGDKVDFQAQGCHTGAPGYKGLQAGMTTLCRSQLYPPFRDYEFGYRIRCMLSECTLPFFCHLFTNCMYLHMVNVVTSYQHLIAGEARVTCHFYSVLLIATQFRIHLHVQHSCRKVFYTVQCVVGQHFVPDSFDMPTKNQYFSSYSNTCSYYYLLLFITYHLRICYQTKCFRGVLF